MRIVSCFLKMIIRKFKQSDYEMVAKWWTDNGWGHLPPLDVLPTDGYIANNGSTDVSACFAMYSGNSPWVFLTWMVTNKSAPMRDKFLGLEHCVRYAQEEALSRDKPNFVTFNQSSSLIKVLEKTGFEKAEVGCTALTYHPKKSLNFTKEDKFLESK